MIRAGLEAIVGMLIVLGAAFCLSHFWNRIVGI